MERRISRRYAELLIVISLVFICSAVPQMGHGQDAANLSPREQLTQDVTQLRANPADDALRTRIIQLALTLDPKPAVPQDAAIDAAKGKTIFASASSADDMKAAAAAFAQATQLAPWIPEYYFNEGLALEKAKQYDDAIRALNLYLLAAPNAADAADVRGKIEGIKYEKESEAKHAAEELTKAQAAAEAEELKFLQNLSGTWCKGPDQVQCNYRDFGFSLTVDGNSLAMVGEREEYRGNVSGHRLVGSYLYRNDFHGNICGKGVVQYPGSFVGTISEDGQMIEVHTTSRMIDFTTCGEPETTLDAKFWKR
jgi:tetratricopeptide (TPR) repeat protein